MLPTAWVYFLTNRHNSTLYTGVTTDLSTRLWEHQSEQQKKSFSARYNLYKLVYVEPFPTLVEAIRREKYLKGKSRAFKEALIHKANPDWNDLSNNFIDGRFLTDEGRPPQRRDTPQDTSS
jgi:putative endonuclease